MRVINGQGSYGSGGGGGGGRRGGGGGRRRRRGEEEEEEEEEITVWYVAKVTYHKSRFYYSKQ